MTMASGRGAEARAEPELPVPPITPEEPHPPDHGHRACLLGMWKRFPNSRKDCIVEPVVSPLKDENTWTLVELPRFSAQKPRQTNQRLCTRHRPCPIFARLALLCDRGTSIRPPSGSTGLTALPNRGIGFQMVGRRDPIPDLGF